MVLKVHAAPEFHFLTVLYRKLVNIQDAADTNKACSSNFTNVLNIKYKNLKKKTNLAGKLTMFIYKFRRIFVQLHDKISFLFFMLI